MDPFECLKEAATRIDELEAKSRSLFTELLAIYSTRFPELDTIPLNPVQYSRIVLAVNGSPILNVPELKTFLPQAIHLVISMSATNSKGKLLSANQLSEATQIARELLAVDTLQKEIFENVELEINNLAPNLSVLVGPRIAALMLVAAGGLKSFTRIPAGNIANLGAKEYLPMLYSTQTALPSQRRFSLLELSDFVRDAPSDYAQFALRLLTSKVVLAGRADFAKSSRDGSLGRSLLHDIETKFLKRTEPEPLKAPKALAVPQVLPRKKRGGKRVRKQKELYKTTEVRRLQNRVSFGQEEEEVIIGEDVVGLGISSRARTIDAKVSTYLRKMPSRPNRK